MFRLEDSLTIWSKTGPSAAASYQDNVKGIGQIKRDSTLNPVERSPLK